MKRLLIINNQDSFTYNLVDMIRRLAVPFDVVNVQELDVDEVANYSYLEDEYQELIQKVYVPVG